MTIVDSSVLIDWINGRDTSETEWLDRQMAIEPVGMLDLILCEVLQGTPNVAVLELTAKLLSDCSVFSTDITVAIEAARNYQILRGFGITIRTTIDCLIATFCIRKNYALLHRDRDFDSFERRLGLKVVRP